MYPVSSFRRLRAIVLLIAAGANNLIGADPPEIDLERRFVNTVRPFIESYCVGCHGVEKPKARFDMSGYSTVESVVRDHGHWELILEKLTEKEMPPEEADQHPAAEVRGEVVAWIQAMRRNEARKNAGDPGPALVRRLSTAEYDYTIRDLTGVDIRPTREFPVDPANEAGFDNSAESLSMSPALLKKYLAAARRVSEFLVLKPDGFTFAPHPVIADTDRDKYCVTRIIEFYNKQPTDYADYFMAAWRFRHRESLDRPTAPLADFAAEEGISPKYLAKIWSALTNSQEDIGPIAALQAMWMDLPGEDNSEDVRAGCARMRDFVVKLRARLVPEVENLSARPVHRGSQPLVLWKDRQFAANRKRYAGGALDIRWNFNPSSDETDDLGRNKTRNGKPYRGRPAPIRKTEVRAGDRKGIQTYGRIPLSSRLPVAPSKRKDGVIPAVTFNSVPLTAVRALAIPADKEGRELYEAAFERFSAIFPDAFFVSERARVYLDPEKEKGLEGRLLSAGFHSMTGYFRDDGPLCEMILDDKERRDLDRLWDEFEFISSVPIRMHTSFLWFERSDSRFMMSPEFHFARAEDKDSTSEAKLRQLAQVYLAKVRDNRVSDVAISAIEEHFRNVNANVRRVENARRLAEDYHLVALNSFAERAFRRPLSQTERYEISSFYRSLREVGNLDHAEAVLDSLVSILMSPFFCYRVDLADTTSSRTGGDDLVDQVGTGLKDTVEAVRTQYSNDTDPVSATPTNVLPLSDYALASRLSYFLWASMPDKELLEVAASRDLHRPEVLVSQAGRMLQDPRARGLAAEFGGNWLDFRRFEEHNAVDRERFSTFDDELRQSMFEEPIRFFMEIIQADRSVLDFLYADYTFVNTVLARHYKMPEKGKGSEEWGRRDDAKQYGRGGLLPMAVFLTKNAPGLRTSPVKRGYWVVRRLLGERIPPPPPNVPELPSDEGNLGDLTLREVLERHRQDKSCAGCHERFDALGLVFEGYGPIGERRKFDLGGRPVDTHAAFPGGGEGSGLEGLRKYLRDHRQQEFLDNLCRKTLAYGLGRNLMLSDESTVSDLNARLRTGGYRFSRLVESIVTSPQFLNKRIRNNFETN